MNTKAPSKPVVSLQFEAIGTSWKIDLTIDPSGSKQISKLISQRIIDFDRNYSRFRPDSWVTHVGNNPGKHQVPADFGPMYQFYVRMYQATNGLVTPLIGDAMERAGYNREYSLKPKKLRAIPRLEDVVHFDNNTLHVKYKCVFDFGAAGKGYLVDLIGKLLDEQGIVSYQIDAGGDILHHSPVATFTTSVGLEDPADTTKAIGIVDLASAALCGSAGNRRKWNKYNHIIDPSTLQSVTSVAAAWTVAATTIEADGLATCLFFVEPKVLQKKFSFEYVVLDSNHRAQLSANFPGKLFTAGG